MGRARIPELEAKVAELTSALSDLEQANRVMVLELRTMERERNAARAMAQAALDQMQGGRTDGGNERD